MAHVSGHTSMGWTLQAADVSQEILFSPNNRASVTSVHRELRDIFTSTLAIPTYAAALSFVILFAHASWRYLATRHHSGRRHSSVVETPIIYAFNFFRLLACLALLGMEIWRLVHYKNVATWSERVLGCGLCTVWGYATFLAFLSITSSAYHARIAIQHLRCVLFATWLVFAYRDLYPLATYDLEPLDSEDGNALWAYIGTQTAAAFFVPLFVPRPYLPVDPKHPSVELNPEQTASVASWITYTYLDRLIYKANHVDHLSVEQLPAVPDYDEAKYMVTRGLAILQPYIAKKRHIAFGFLDVFRSEYLAMSFTTLLMVATSFATPIGVRMLLKHIETGGDDASIRPWFWILAIFVGPSFGAIIRQAHTFLLNVIGVRSGAIINQLVFDHALHIRLKAEVGGEASSGQPTDVPTPDTASLLQQPGLSEESPEDSSDVGRKPDQLQAQTSDAVSETSTKVTGEAQPTENNLLGRINNLVTTDAANISNGADLAMIVLYVPVQLSLCVLFLYAILGWSSFVGIGATVLFFPVPGYFSKMMAGTQKTKMQKTDARVQTVTETMNTIRMIKLFGWEPKMIQRIAKMREEELVYIKWERWLYIFIGISVFAIPFITVISTFATYTLIMRKELTASVLFPSMVVFDMFRSQMWTIAQKLPMVLRAKVSLDRINAFLYDTELLDHFASGSCGTHGENVVAPETIGFKNALFTWDAKPDGTTTPDSNRRTFTLRIEDEVVFQRSHINLIVGPTGSGKTSMLMALLGEMHFIPQGPDSYYNLPRDGGIAYASQESWVQNKTIRDNIVFGSEYDRVRYDKVIEQCGLSRDIELFEAGDMTEVGEKGLTLSGGQKARITLARAIYSKAEVLLLDDVLAALDVHTAKWIVDECLKGDLIRGRTVLLVTHNIALTSPIAEFVVSIGRNGCVTSQGSLSAVLAKDAKLYTKMQTELAKAEEPMGDMVPLDEAKRAADGKLVVAEEIALGRVGWREVTLFFGALGGKRWLLWWTVFIANALVTPIIETFDTWFLGYWAHQYESRPSSEVPASSYLSIYTVIVFTTIMTNTAGYLYFFVGAVRASRTIHEKLVSSVLGSTMRWLDTTPTSRVISRCTRDIAAVDDVLPLLVSQTSDMITFMLVQFCSVVLVAPATLIPGIMVFAAGGLLGKIYLKAQLSVKREMSNAQSPILSHFSAAMAGLVSIRAYGVQTAIKEESFVRIDKYTRTFRAFNEVNRWMSIRIETIGAAFAAGIAAYLAYGKAATASNTGFALSMTVGFCELIKHLIYAVNSMEVQANSLERIQQYLEIEHELRATSDGVPPAYWPAGGNLAVEKLSAKYSEDGPNVLHDLNFTINAGEPVGIVGRTGSGKSSLTLALLRCILTEGKVYFDGLPTDSVNLDALRSSITIIPQVPELLSGTLRQNLDPFDEYDDAVLNDSLRTAGLFSLQHIEEDARLTLETAISSGGGNLSVGQRQILALARAMVRRSKLLILDEATSAIDNETDNVIQASLRNELDKDVTVLTVAHRLQTIMDADKIMVLDAGRLVEFGEPGDLLRNDAGLFRALVDGSGDKELLYSMAKRSS
ncbi:hypothetical protein BXZ70DRAFT_101862 [Cristinia sonorae]|uniref:P-loop containing nucleoside triphosphate hydrolase protein n=1 Tax=Cristinia sonorae TaxID=1940300 RepID=A0A8K0UQ17_9AGAR|nr:hypothetical protein BXZ70DRAFT_101862 [Cristinia sonorae]